MTTMTTRLTSCHYSCFLASVFDSWLYEMYAHSAEVTSLSGCRKKIWGKSLQSLPRPCLPSTGSFTMDGETRQLKTCDPMTRAMQKKRRKFPVVLACRRLGGIKVAPSVAEWTQSPHCRYLGGKKNKGVEF